MVLAMLAGAQEEEMEQERKGLFARIAAFFGGAFSDMKEGAKAQAQVDKANFQAVRAESKAAFEENKFHNSLERAKQDAKESWEEAKAMRDPERRKAMEQAERDKAIEEAEARKAAAEKRYEEAKK